VAEQTDSQPREEKKSSFGLSQRNQYLVVGVLAAFLVGLLLHQSVAGGQEADAPAVQPQNGNGLEPLPLPLAALPLPDEPVMPDPVPELARDPFALPDKLRKRLEKQVSTDEGGLTVPIGPDPEIIAEAQTLVVKGIMGRTGNRMAFINNRPIRAGGTIAGFTVVEVRESSVLLNKDDTEVELKLQSVPEGDDDGGY
jgi:hypothetical protein